MKAKRPSTVTDFVTECVLDLVEEGLEPRVTKGDGGVTRIAYYDGSKKVGEARLMGHTIGDIEVYERYRRKGYGMQMLKDLEGRGGTHAIIASDASKGLFEKAGWKRHGHTGSTYYKESTLLSEGKRWINLKTGEIEKAYGTHGDHVLDDPEHFGISAKEAEPLYDEDDVDSGENMSIAVSMALQRGWARMEEDYGELDVQANSPAELVKAIGHLVKNGVNVHEFARKGKLVLDAGNNFITTHPDEEELEKFLSTGRFPRRRF